MHAQLTSRHWKAVRGVTGTPAGGNLCVNNHAAQHNMQHSWQSHAVFPTGPKLAAGHEHTGLQHLQHWAWAAPHSADLHQQSHLPDAVMCRHIQPEGGKLLVGLRLP